ncbi:MAG: hypothetical protein LUG13_09225 [Oscillospiraceae bacterium]|nr:hypothetical protein [Oscillospiraceae bacterium]
MNESISILHPEYLNLTGTDGAVYHGADQEWYPRRWQRMAGCGPTAASDVSAYLAQTHPACAPLYPERVMRQERFVVLMERLWRYVTPGHMGLHRPELFSLGLTDYAAACGVPLSPRLLDIPADKGARAPWASCAVFLRQALARDCPVAFLNLSNGAVKALESWHWVVITGLNGTTATVLDSGRVLTIDLSLWYLTTTKRGGLVAAI